MASTVDAQERHVSRRLRQLLAGAISGAVTKTAIAPLERVKILLQVQGMKGEQKYRGVMRTMMIVIREEGMLALYKGNGANVARVIPNYAVKFSATDWLKELVRQPGQSIKDLSFAQVMASGTLAGLMQIFVSYPLDVIRTRLSLSSALLTGGIKYNGMLDCTRQMIRHEGWTSLYKGLWPTVWSGSPYVGLQMTCYHVFQGYLPHGVVWNLTAGAASGLVAQTITYPGDTVRKRMQANGLGGLPKEYRSSWDCCQKIFAKEGAMGFFQGWRANAIRCIPGAAIQFAAYDACKVLLKAE
jgi:hypothetical protein